MLLIILQAEDQQMAQTINEQEYVDEGQSIECGCCYGDYAFDAMVHCYEGHLFCEECLHGYAKEAVYGQGKSVLQCMADQCEAIFPKSKYWRGLILTWHSKDFVAVINDPYICASLTY